MNSSHDLITTSIRLSPDVLSRLDDQSLLLQTTRSTLIRDCIREMLDRWQAGGRDRAVENLLSRILPAATDEHHRN